MPNKNVMNIAKQYLQYMKNLDKVGNDSYKNNDMDQYQTCIKLISYYMDQILYLIEIPDCKISLESTDPNSSTYKKWLLAWSEFVSSHPIRMHTSLTRNPNLTSTDKIVGATIDTMLGFLLINANPTPKVFPISLQLVAHTDNISVQQVKDSISHLKNHL